MSEAEGTSFNMLAANIGSLPEKLTDAAFEILWQNAYLIAGLAQMYVPVKTGNLRDHIEVIVTVNGEEIKEIAVEANTDYAAIVEAKHPFLAPAVAEVQPQIEAALKSLQGSVIDAST
jgi:hypothetical protein